VRVFENVCWHGFYHCTHGSTFVMKRNDMSCVITSCFVSTFHTFQLVLRQYAGNVLSLLATESVGIAIAYPIFQCGLFVAGVGDFCHPRHLCRQALNDIQRITPDTLFQVWGIMLFDEIERQAIPAYLLSGVALIAGACFLGLSK